MPSLIRVRPLNLIHQLAARGNHLTVCTLWTDEQERCDVQALEKYAGVKVIAMHQPAWQSMWNCIKALPTRIPLQAVYSWQPEMESKIKWLLSGNGRTPIDIVHVEHLRGSRYGLSVKSHFLNVPVVWDSVDCISYLFEQASAQSRSLFGRLITSLDLKRTRRFEGWLAGQFDHSIITSVVDKQALLDLVPENVDAKPIDVLPNGVDWDYFGEGEQLPRDPATIIFSGKMSYHANITMVMYLVNEIMPLIWVKRPDTKLLIVGKDPPKKVRLLGQHPAISVTGTVPDLRPYLRQATVAIVPLVYGAGFQNKVTEAMACGTPVVTTPKTLMAMSAVPGKDLLVAETPAEFANRVLDLFGQPALAYRIGQEGKKYVKDNHHWTGIAERLELIYQQAASNLQIKRRIN